MANLRVFMRPPCSGGCISRQEHPGVKTTICAVPSLRSAFHFNTHWDYRFVCRGPAPISRAQSAVTLDQAGPVLSGLRAKIVRGGSASLTLPELVSMI